jgi:hypothetical protein
MALSYNQSSDLSDKTFSFSFDYIDLQDVHVIGQRISDNAWVQLTVTARDPDAKTVTVSDNLTPYDLVQVYRQTTVAPIVDFQNGARLTERDLDNAYRQGLFAAQEVAENANQSTQREDVDTDLIADSAINTAKIANGAVTDQKLATNLNLSTHNVTFASDEISGSEIADGTIDSNNLANGSVDNVHLAGNIDLTTKVTGALPAANGGTGVSTVLPFRVKSVSGELAVPAVRVKTSYEHLLGQVPEMFLVYLKCKEIDAGYTYDDLILLNQDTNGNNPITISADEEYITINRSGSIYVSQKTTGYAAALTTSYWSFIIKAYA